MNKIVNDYIANHYATHGSFKMGLLSKELKQQYNVKIGPEALQRRCNEVKEKYKFN